MDKEKYNAILSAMPAPFKSKLDRIRRFLYLGKASVMVGAGFSRNADIPSQINVKQWNDLGKDIYCRLYAERKVNYEDLIFKTPMRLASQYSASFGRSALDSLIKDSIPDERMRPGPLHRHLMSLPWRDVFTTNYDTLLERSCDGLERSYSVITTKEMLLYKNSPRIVKLHGSFPDKTPFLMTEEDYRTYPVDHPEFVNTVRQALVESIFCLIGFSGDDPNFTSWQGWLRDVMGDYAGPSYLITCDENYDESFEVLMEHRGIDVLNFSIIDGINDHKTALEFLFEYLSEKSISWTGRVNYSSKEVSSVPSHVIDELKAVRLSYPGWFVLPSRYYTCFRDMEETFPNLENSFKTIGDELIKEALLAELDWRADISLTFKDFDWYRGALEAVIDTYESKTLSENTVNLGISLLRLYRHHPEKVNEISKLKEKLDEVKICMSDIQLNRYYYVLACNALSVFDYSTVEQVMSSWLPAPSCYEGIIHKSLVLVEIGAQAIAVRLLSEAYDRITQSLSQNDSTEEKSLRVAIESLLECFQGIGITNNKDPQYSFISNRADILSKVNEPQRESFEIVHGYGIGSENRSWNMSSGIVKQLLYPYRCLLLNEAYGMPYGMATNTLDEKVLLIVLPQLNIFDCGISLGFLLRSGSRNVTVKYATRSLYNSLSQKDADVLAERLLDNALQTYSSEAKTRRITEVLLPFLSRLSTSCSQPIVVRLFKFALEAYMLSRSNKHEDINIIYSSLLPESIQEVYSLVFSSKIICDNFENDVPLPVHGYDFYSPGKEEIDVVCSGFASEDKRIREFAYYRTEYLYVANIMDEFKIRLEEAVRKWRSSEEHVKLIYHSYIRIKALPDEEERVRTHVDDVIGEFVRKDITVSDSSGPISSLADDIRSIVFLAKFMSNEQRSDVLSKLINVLETNFEQFSMDDSDECLGGLRGFVYHVFERLNDFVMVICRNGYDDANLCDKLFKVLEEYIDAHLPVRRTMVSLNLISHTRSDSRIKDLIIAQLFSRDKSDVIDSCNALITYVRHHSSIQQVLQQMTFYCECADSEKRRLYLQTMSMIPFDCITGPTKEKMASMMLNILECVPNQDISEECKADIMHDGVRLAASLKSASIGASLEKAVKQWEEYALNSENFNDVRQPWFILR